MSTASLRRDHELIEKVVKAMDATIQLLNENKTIPESILLPVIDFSKNFAESLAPLFSYKVSFFRWKCPSKSLIN